MYMLALVDAYPPLWICAVLENSEISKLVLRRRGVTLGEILKGVVHTLGHR